MREFAFELSLCARLEADGELVARQLGTAVHHRANRIADIVCLEPGPAFDERAAITPETIPAAAIDAPVGVGKARPRRQLFPDHHPDRAQEIVDRAVDIGFFERERRGGQEVLRQVARYPAEWFGRIRAIENKPALATPGDLEAQLRTDVRLALVDEVILATASHVTGAHLNRLPDAVGVWRVHDDEIEVIREPTSLPATDPGIEIIDEQPGRTDVRFVTAGQKRRARRDLAERAYGKGWRTYAFPACAACEPAKIDGSTLPHCGWKGRIVDAGSECGPACRGYEPSDPPDVDLAGERAAGSPWRPATPRRRQAGLDRFT